MPLLPLSRSPSLAFPSLNLSERPAAMLRPLLRLLAGPAPVLPDDMEDWQLRDLGLTRPWPGPGRSLTPWLP